MKKRLLLWASLILSLTLTAQNLDYDNSILINARNEGDGLFLDWPAHPTATSYFIKKREKGQTNYKPLVNLPGNAQSYTDSAVVKGKVYEYHITRQTTNSNVGAAIAAGIEAAPIHHRGGVVLIIENEIAQALPDELNLYQNDLTEEGWTVFRLGVFSTSKPDSIKAALKTLVANTSQVKIESIVLIGKVTVPYAGNLAPDGHSPDHVGAWPADVYYAELDGIWTDNAVNVTGATGTRNDNVPGDGKFDNSSIPGKVELACGRIDLSDLPAFPEGEISLMRKYFEKNHQFRKGQTPYVRRGLIQNNFASYAEAFGQSGVNNFCRFFGRDSVKYLPYKSTLQTQSYLFSYGCGAGHYQGASGIGTTGELVNENHQTIFTLIFGSYFGDWHNTNNYLRAPLASGQVLTNAWAGRPVWHLHHMAMGETIGYGTRISQNNSSEFSAGFGATGVHIALMGDPTLTLLPFHGVEELTATVHKDSVSLSWSKSIDTDLSFYVYRKKKDESIFTLVTPVAQMIAQFTESCVSAGDYEYLVRPVRLEYTGSGSYYNVGPGQKIAVTFMHNLLPELKLDHQVYYDELSINTSILNGSLVQLNTGDGRIITDSLPPTLLYEQEGSYKVCLTVENLCVSIDSCFTIDIKSSLPVLNVAVSEAACSDDKGGISIQVQETRVPFEVSWSHQDTGFVLSDLAEGAYLFTVTTLTGKSAVYGPFVVVIPEEISAIINSTACDVDQNNGSLVIAQINGGSPPYTIAWIDGVFGEATQFSNLAPGSYLVQIKDSNGCLFDTTVVISRLSGTSVVNKETNLIYFDEKGYLLSGPDAGAAVQLCIYDLGGKLVKQGSFEKIQHFVNREMTVSGVYVIRAWNEKQQQVIKWVNGR